MADPLIAIVGSADPDRTDYDPPIRYVQQVTQAAQQLGSELAKAGYRILVYSSADKYIEKDVVTGYVSSGKAKPESIQVRYPQVVDPKGPRPFLEQSSQVSLFERYQDTHPNWMVSFYSSLQEVDGILLLGGANSALITGLVAQIYRIPLVSISTFGGSAQTVWALSIRKLATDEERNLMGLPDWDQNSASKLIAILGAQRERLVSEEAQRLRAQALEKSKMQWRVLVAGLLVLASAILTVFGFFLPKLDPLSFGFIFLFTPMLSGASGGVIRTILDWNRGLAIPYARSTLEAVVLGMAAGLVTAVLFVLAQLASNPAIKDFEKGIPAGLNWLVAFALIIGFIAGLTLELVFGKLQKTDVTTVEPVTAKGVQVRKS
jgi:hypothetical protein